MASLIVEEVPSSRAEAQEFFLLSPLGLGAVSTGAKGTVRATFAAIAQWWRTVTFILISCSSSTGRSSKTGVGWLRRMVIFVRNLAGTVQW